MTDARAAFLQDVKEKRVTARSARNRRPHAGSVAEGDTPTEAAKGATMASTALDIIEDIREAPAFTQQRHQDGAYPYSGCLTFDGAADAALALVSSILWLADVRLKIEWEARPKTCDTAKEE